MHTENYQRLIWQRWGTQDGTIGILPEFICIEPAYAKIYWDAYWKAFFLKRLS